MTTSMRTRRCVITSNEMSFDFGIDVESVPWTAVMLLENTFIPEDLTIARGEQGAKLRVGNQRLKNAHIILSRCGFRMHVNMVLRHYNNKKYENCAEERRSA